MALDRSSTTRQGGRGRDEIRRRDAELRALADEPAVPCGLRELGLREDQLDTVAALTEPSVPEDNSVSVGDGSLRRLGGSRLDGEDM
ncbi:hypothetical protein PA7_03530 [Pseudonocardia asaccharolytica DSM 44247 = NBRC 16224]|uniref:Uncharacterized protein n=1 Tax=Pseudonocardia asaccharolytica DSM 44247 = NBRC 16224 TaxID=1123024 RepID=A0A511CVB7_9PSEU|nr:hypothetical protein PA7_03530 [Pseudonocardia asaccharolytica DSM 44247 = NBRC 16224]